MSNKIYPAFVQLRSTSTGWRRISWEDFAAANPEIADAVAADIAADGFSVVGGGAAPAITIMEG